LPAVDYFSARVGAIALHATATAARTAAAIVFFPR